jgi:L-lysine 2,3-aminomutase
MKSKKAKEFINEKCFPENDGKFIGTQIARKAVEIAEQELEALHASKIERVRKEERDNAVVIHKNLCPMYAGYCYRNPEQLLYHCDSVCDYMNEFINKLNN